MNHQRPVAIFLVGVLLVLTPLSARAAGEHASGRIGEGIQRAVEATTGINTDDYPCARAGIHALYEKRLALQELSVLHPQRIITWMIDIMRYITIKIIHFFKAIFNPAAIQKGLGSAVSQIRSGGNPLAGMDQSIERAFGNVSAPAQVSLKSRVESIIASTTNDDGSCKK